MKFIINGDPGKFLEVVEDPGRNRVIIESNVEPIDGNGIFYFGECKFDQIMFYNIKLLTNFETSKAWVAYPDFSRRNASILGYYGYIITEVSGNIYVG